MSGLNASMFDLAQTSPTSGGVGFGTGLSLQTPQAPQIKSLGEIAGDVGGASLLSSVPWLGVVNLFSDVVGGIVAFRQAAEAERKAEQERRRLRVERAAVRGEERRLGERAFKEDVRRFDVQRKDALRREFANRFTGMVSQRPALRQSLNRLRGVNQARQAMFSQVAQPQAPVQPQAPAPATPLIQATGGV